MSESLDSELQRVMTAANALIAKSDQVKSSASSEDSAEMKVRLIEDLRAASQRQSLDDIRRVKVAELEDLIFYLNDA